jgi:twitching motility protein PilT
VLLNNIFSEAKKINASDIHISYSYKVRFRVDGIITTTGNYNQLTPKDIKAFAYSLISTNQREIFEKNKELDFSFSLNNQLRIRANYFFALGRINMAFRLIPFDVPILANLKLPYILNDFIKIENGLILVTGSTGSGKTTTICAMLNEININYNKHIITIEDPVEFIHTNKKSIISQRNIGTDTKSFESGLKSILREDPDVIFVGEIRDKESMKSVLSLAETGHLVFATLHTNSVVSTINRVLDFFHDKDYVKSQLANSLRVIISQQFVTKDNQRVIECNILENNTAISNLIRENRIHQIENQMKISNSIK